MTERYELAQQLAEAAVEIAGIDSKPAISAERLASELGVAKHELDIEEDGRLRLDGQQPVALLRRDRPLERKRFTLCHEVAHWLLLSGVAGEEVTRLACAASESEEYLCDKVAGAMLMPGSWVQRSYRGWPRTLATVDAIARAAEVSRSAALVRLRDELGWRHSLVQWQNRRGRWVLQGQAGLYPAQHGMVRTTEATRFELSRAAALRRDPNDPLTLQIWSHEVPVVAELRATGSRATALVELPYPSGSARRAVRQYSGAT